jgi:hypothetical protein
MLLTENSKDGSLRRPKRVTNKFVWDSPSLQFVSRMGFPKRERDKNVKTNERES